MNKILKVYDKNHGYLQFSQNLELGNKQFFFSVGILQNMIINFVISGQYLTINHICKCKTCPDKKKEIPCTNTHFPLFPTNKKNFNKKISYYYSKQHRKW